MQALLATYNTVLTFLASLQGREMTPEEKLAFGRILEIAGGISPVELGQVQKERKPAPVAPPVPESVPQPA